MKEYHEIIVEEIKTISRVVKIKRSEYPTVKDAEMFIAEALNNVYADQIGAVKSEDTQILINGLDLDDFEPT